MAAATTRSERSGIYWMNGVSDEEQPLTFVAGVDGDLVPGSTSVSMKSGTKTRTRSTSAYKREPTVRKSSTTHGNLQSGRLGAHTKTKVSHNIATVATDHTPSPALETYLNASQVILEASKAKSQVCLKDLCAEDKRRIANLIEELARVSEEKEESMQRFKDEQEKFECKIQQLEQQNVLIAQERGSLQQQYKECQELLGLYQQYLSQQQAKLNHSAAQHSHVSAHRKVLSSEEIPSTSASRKIDKSLLDGSYLSLDSARAQRLQVLQSTGEGREAAQTCSNHVSPFCGSELCSTYVQTKQHRSQQRERRGPHSESCQRCEHGHSQNSIHGAQQWISCNGSHLENGHHNSLKKYKCERLQSVNAMGSLREESLTRPLLGHEDWEEKRHQLLLQKMQLEMEREKLQARLNEQEERLNRQHQLLQQTHVDNSSNSNTRTKDLQPEGPNHQDLPSSIHQDADINPTDQHLQEKGSQPVPPRDKCIHTHEILERSRRDMETSHSKSPTNRSKPISASANQKTPDARLDFSVVELLDMLSPVSAPEQSQVSTQRTRTTQCRPTIATPKSVGRSLLAPVGPYPQNSQQNLEESQILEDIFFIC